MSRLLILWGCVGPPAVSVRFECISASAQSRARGGSTRLRALGAGSRIPGRARTVPAWGEPSVDQLGEGFRGGPGNGGAQLERQPGCPQRCVGTAKANGANVVRWWGLEGDAWQIKRTLRCATTLDEAVYQDFDGRAPNR